MHVSLRSPLLAVLLGLSTARAQNLTSSTCGAQCQTLSEGASAFEISQHASPDYSFYTAPANFSSSLPEGSLLHVEYATNLSTYTVPSGLSMSRIIYTTADLNGTILPTSAYVLWPYSPLASAGLKQNQFPVVAWAHGTSGYSRGCAPSNYKSLQYHFMVPYKLALEGMVVVAPDYAGLGIDKFPDGRPIQHNWLNGPSQATDLANAVIAARKAFPAQLPAEGPFVTLGHSQGGTAAWAFSERLVDKPLKGYKGTVTIAPPPRIFDLLAQVLADPAHASSPVILTQQPALIAAVTAAYPAYNYSGMTPLSYDRWVNVLEPLAGCLPVQSLAYADVPIDQLAKPGWINDTAAQLYASRTHTGRKNFKGPLLVLAGEADMVVSIDQVRSTVNGTCNLLKQNSWNQSLEFVTYGSMNHFPTIQASSMKWLSWIKDRLSGKQVAQTGCVESRQAGFRTNFTEPTLTPNFFVEWESPQDAWKLSL